MKQEEFRRLISEHMEEQRVLHKDIMTAVIDTKVAAAEARMAAETIEKSGKELAAWTLAIQKRVEGLEHFKTGAIAGGAVVAFLLKEKVMAVLGLKVSE